MLDISAVSNLPLNLGHGPTRSEPRAAQAREDELPPAIADRLELSRSLPTRIRADVVERIRAQIAAGEYLSDEKLDATVDALVRDVIAR